MQRRRAHIWTIVLLGAALTLAGCATQGGNDGMHRAKTPDARKHAAQVHTELGQGYMSQGKLKLALQKLQDAVRFDANYAPAHTVLGALYSRIGEMAKAEREYQRAVQIEPKNGNTNNNYAQVLCREGKVAKAMPYFKKALDDPFYKTRALASTNAGVCQAQAHHYKQAQEHFAAALKANPNYAGALYQMARVLYLQGDAFHASAFIQRYDALGLSSAPALKLGYDIATRLGNGEGAQDYARQLRSKFPDSEQTQALNKHAKP